jgi:hypothetical protein
MEALEAQLIRQRGEIDGLQVQVQEARRAQAPVVVDWERLITPALTADPLADPLAEYTFADLARMAKR